MQQYLRQPTKTYRVNITLPNKYDSLSVDLWLKATLGIEVVNNCSSKKEIYQFSYKALLIINALLQASNIPAFYPGEILTISKDSRVDLKYTVDLAISDIGLISNMHFATVVNFAFKAVLWMMQNKITPQNKQAFYQLCLKDIINPLRAMTPPGKSRIPVLKVAYAKEIPFINLGSGVYQLGWGSQARRMDRSTTDTDSAMGLGMSQNKVVSANLLRMGGLPSPTHAIATNRENALTLAKQLQGPIVIKPIDLDRGEGVYVNLLKDEEIVRAFEEALKLSKTKQVIIEKQVEGVCHRLFIAEGELLYAVKRLPKSIEADGVKSISQLIDMANAKENDKAPWMQSELFPKDDLAVCAIKNYGFSMDSIPLTGEWIPLRDIESTRWGGRDEDVTFCVHPDNVDIAIRATKLFGLNVAGIDIITTDISKPWHQTGAIINEVNFAPLLGGGEISRSYIPTFFDRFMKGSGRIPIEIFVGHSDETLHQAKLKQQYFIKTGLRCYLTSHAQTLDELGHELYFPLKNGIAARCQALLINTNIDALVIVIENDEFLHYQIPFDKVSNVYIISQNIQNHQNEHETLDAHNIRKLVTLFHTK